MEALEAAANLVGSVGLSFALALGLVWLCLRATFRLMPAVTRRANRARPSHAARLSFPVKSIELS